MPVSFKACSFIQGSWAPWVFVAGDVPGPPKYPAQSNGPHLKMMGIWAIVLGTLEVQVLQSSEQFLVPLFQELLPAWDFAGCFQCKQGLPLATRTSIFCRFL